MGKGELGVSSQGEKGDSWKGERTIFSVLSGYVLAVRKREREDGEALEWKVAVDTIYSYKKKGKNAVGSRRGRGGHLLALGVEKAGRAEDRAAMREGRGRGETLVKGGDNNHMRYSGEWGNPSGSGREKKAARAGRLAHACRKRWVVSDLRSTGGKKRKRSEEGEKHRLLFRVGKGEGRVAIEEKGRGSAFLFLL